LWSLSEDGPKFLSSSSRRFW